MDLGTETDNTVGKTVFLGFFLRERLDEESRELSIAYCDRRRVMNVFLSVNQLLKIEEKVQKGRSCQVAAQSDR